MKIETGYNDPMLRKLHSSIRSLRQAQRQAIRTYRTYEAAQEALDGLACDGIDTSEARIKLGHDARFHLQNVHN